MRAALAVRDIQRVYRLLKRHGISQRRISALTGQGQPEISEIMKSGRRVISYELLARIADALGIPRGYMGLAYTDRTNGGSALAGGGAGVASWCWDDEGGDDVKRRAFFAFTAKAAVVGVSAAELAQVAPASAAPAAGRIGEVDVRGLEQAISFWRAQDDELGGGAVAGAVSGHLPFARGLLTADAADDIRQRVAVAVADLHSLAGWASFDVGHRADARAYLAYGLAVAKDAGNHEMASKICWQLGRIFLHSKDFDGSLKLFQLGQVNAAEAQSPRAAALMAANQAWADAELNRPDQVRRELDRASEEMGHDKKTPPAWLAFMGQSEIDGMTGMAYNSLASHDRTYADRAIEAATRSRDARPESDARSRASDSVAIAANLLRTGSLDTGLTAAQRVIPQVQAIHSRRLTDRLQWIEQAAGLYPRNGDARQVVREVHALRAGTPQT
ncbi:helix-turn-helix domain-containing protein [Amycolatopsis sp. NPDC059027]|uniref:helix-turn-helix domain-containing protein n=1 Tax=Amycolatopsis sp. NPDC059027 TaxID=3346709 RepID=UPI00366C6E0F